MSFLNMFSGKADKPLKKKPTKRKKPVKKKTKRRKK